ncbi:GumC domain-containing protein, partial [Singulisphaera rosea]
MLIGSSLGVALVLVGTAWSQRIYRSTAKFLIVEREGRPINVANNDPTRQAAPDSKIDYVQTHALILSSPVVIARAIESIGLDALPSLKSAEAKGRRALDAAVAAVSVSRPDRNANVLAVDCTAWSPEEATRLLTGVVRSYREFLKITYEDTNRDAATLIVKAKDELGAELDTLESKYVEFRREASYLTDEETGSTVADRRLARTSRELWDAEAKARALKVQLDLVRKLADKDHEIWSIAHAASFLGGESGSLDTTIGAATTSPSSAAYLAQLMVEQQQLIERFGAENAKSRELQAQIQRASEQARLARRTLGKTEVSKLLESIAEGLTSAETMRRELAETCQRQEEQARRSEIEQLAGKNLWSKVERQRTLFDTVVDQLKQVQFAGGAGDVLAQELEAPQALVKPIHPRTGLLLAVGLLVGGSAGLASSLLRERLDRRVRTTGELKAALGLPLLGQVRRLAGEDRFRLDETTSCASDALTAQAFQTIFTHLESCRRRSLFKSLLVASPRHDDGRSIAASNM